jgi:hypothetical protein
VVRRPCLVGGGVRLRRGVRIVDVDPRVVEIVEPAMWLVGKTVKLRTGCSPGTIKARGETSANCVKVKSASR